MRRISFGYIGHFFVLAGLNLGRPFFSPGRVEFGRRIIFDSPG
jgi:hypothetical protein